MPEALCTLISNIPNISLPFQIPLISSAAQYCLTIKHHTPVVSKRQYYIPKGQVSPFQMDSIHLWIYVHYTIPTDRIIKYGRKQSKDRPTVEGAPPKVLITECGLDKD